MEILFVLGFFLMLLLTGVSLLGVIAALVVATVVMFVGGLFTLVFKLLPWLLLAVVAVWAWRYFQHTDDDKLATLRRKISRLDRNSWR